MNDISEELTLQVLVVMCESYKNNVKNLFRISRHGVSIEVRCSMRPEHTTTKYVLFRCSCRTESFLFTAERSLYEKIQPHLPMFIGHGLVGTVLDMMEL